MKAALEAKARAKRRRRKQKRKVSSMGKATVIPFRPQHPVLPEPLHLDPWWRDETVIEAVPQIGFIHRGLEKLVETRDYNQFIYVAERICGICAFGHSIGLRRDRQRSSWASEIPERAEYLRVIWHELSAYPLPRAVDGTRGRRIRFREPVHALLACLPRARARHLRETTGGRVIFSVVKVGGVVRDIDDAQFAEMKRVLEGIKDEYRQLCNAFPRRQLGEETAPLAWAISAMRMRLAQSMVGPFARASNVNYDARMLGNGGYGFLSGLPAHPRRPRRLLRSREGARALEVLQSIDIIEEMIAKIPAGDIAVDVKGSPAAGAEAANVVEQPRGECYYYARGNGSKFLDRMRIRTPTSQNLAGIATALARCDHSRRQHDRAHHRPLHQLHGKVGGPWEASSWEK